MLHKSVYDRGREDLSPLSLSFSASFETSIGSNTAISHTHICVSIQVNICKLEMFERGKGREGECANVCINISLSLSRSRCALFFVSCLCWNFRCVCVCSMFVHVFVDIRVFSFQPVYTFDIEHTHSLTHSLSAEVIDGHWLGSCSKQTNSREGMAVRVCVYLLMCSIMAPGLME